MQMHPAFSCKNIQDCKKGSVEREMQKMQGMKKMILIAVIIRNALLSKYTSEICNSSCSTFSNFQLKDKIIGQQIEINYPLLFYSFALRAGKKPKNVQLGT